MEQWTGKRMDRNVFKISPNVKGSRDKENLPSDIKREQFEQGDAQELDCRAQLRLAEKEQKTVEERRTLAQH